MAGRPKKPESESRVYMLRIRMTEEERAEMEEAARAAGLQVSTWARSELLKQARRNRPKK